MDAWAPGRLHRWTEARCVRILVLMLSPTRRADLARNSYEKAIAAIRARPTPALWRRLLRAARNLRAALEELGLEPRQEPGR